jgi:hypothetical protein
VCQAIIASTKSIRRKNRIGADRQKEQQVMEKFFCPRSLVVFGASITKMNLGQIVLLNNNQIGYNLIRHCLFVAKL